MYAIHVCTCNVGLMIRVCVYWLVCMSVYWLACMSCRSTILVLTPLRGVLKPQPLGVCGLGLLGVYSIECIG